MGFKKYLVIGLIILITIFILSKLITTPVLSIHSEKKIYSAKETVKINWGIKTLYYCSCSGPFVRIDYYNDLSKEWKEVLKRKDVGGPFCRNDTIVNPSEYTELCDIDRCEWGYYHNSNTYKWQPTLIVAEESVCAGEKGIYYVEKDAPSGKYRAKFGYASTEFYIK